jgi:hypothetical protein
LLVGVFLGLSEKEGGEKQGKAAASSSPTSRIQGKKKTHNALKTAPFWASLSFF